MKKLLFIFALLAFSLVGFSQTPLGQGRANTVTVDTIQGAETVYFVIPQEFKTDYTLTVQALCTQTGGTTDGTLALQGSLDGTSYSFLNFVSNTKGVSSPAASLTGADLNQITMTNALVAGWELNTTQYLRYRIAGVGTTGDTTKVTIKYTWK